MFEVEGKYFYNIQNMYLKINMIGECKQVVTFRFTKKLLTMVVKSGKKW